MANDGETVRDFILGGFKITVDGDYGHEIKRRLLLGRKAMTNLDSVLKTRDRWEGGSGWGRHVNSRTFHFNV